MELQPAFSRMLLLLAAVALAASGWWLGARGQRPGSGAPSLGAPAPAVWSEVPAR